jgi:dihydrolipoyl dehydrogenase
MQGRSRGGGGAQQLLRRQGNPIVAYSNPEVAWIGMTENEAKAKGVKYGRGVIPWAASGRSLSLGPDEGVTKLLFDEATNRLLGCGIVGPNAGDLIAEAALAIEMGRMPRTSG